MFFSHSHWDHIQGFPFFVPAYNPQTKILVYGVTNGSVDQHIFDLLNGQMSDDYFPVQFHDLGAQIIKKDLNVGGTPMEMLPSIILIHIILVVLSHIPLVQMERRLFIRQTMNRISCLIITKRVWMIHRFFDVLPRPLLNSVEEQTFSLQMGNTPMKNIRLISIGAIQERQLWLIYALMQTSSNLP